MSERIGRYEIVKTLAEGDRGKLFLARSSGYGSFARHVVIKTFEGLPGAAEGSFLEETADLGRLHHQHITPVLDVGRDGERFYVALDFVHGRSAREVFQQALTIRALLPLDFAISVVVAIASGLHYAHARRVVHGHVSLSNVLVGFDGTLRLAGFVGASVRALRASETQLGFSRDQLAYLAPEQVRRAGPVDARSDVFSLGAVLYELTTMSRAFRDDSDRLTIERVKAASYRKPRSFLPDYPPELERIIARALHLEPDARYPNAEAFRRELVAVGHHLELVLHDTAVVELMAQLFEDSTLDPWTSTHTADNAPDDLAIPVANAPPLGRKLRAATEAVDALAVELEIAIEAQPRDATTQSEDRATDPRGAPVIRPALPLPPPPRPPPPVANDTDGVPVLVPLAVPPARPAVPEVSTPSPPSPPSPSPSPSPSRRPMNVRTIAIIAAPATIAITVAIALALRGTQASTTTTTPPPIDAAVRSVATDAAPPPPDASAAETAPPDAATTVRLQITSTPSRGTVLLDGKKLGKTPFDGVVDRAEGKHTIKVRLQGHVSSRIEVDLTKDVQAELTLEPSPPSPDPGGPD